MLTVEFQMREININWHVPGKSSWRMYSWQDPSRTKEADIPLREPFVHADF